MRQTWLVLALLPIIWSVCVGGEDQWQKHHTNDEVKNILDEVHKKCPERTRVYNLHYADFTADTDPQRNTTSTGQHLWVIEFSKNPAKDGSLRHTKETPDFKYIGNMHGNEVVGKEILLRLVDFFCAVLRGEARDAPDDMWDRNYIDWLLDNTNIHIMPSMNPDGWQTAYDYPDKQSQSAWIIGRNNSNNVDLNRNFPDLDKTYYQHEDDYKPRNNHLERLNDELRQHNDYEPETKMVMTWIHSLPWVLSSNMHGGDLVANYPFDEARPGELRHAALTPDNELFRNLALSYAEPHTKMYKQDKKCEPNEKFEEGTTNGAEWYSVPRGMQDYNYLSSNCFEITLELGCDKFPPGSELPMYWEDNFNAMVNFIFQAHIGIKGTVKVPEDMEDIPVVIRVYDYDGQSYIKHDVLSTKSQDYFRLLNDGVYMIEARLSDSANGNALIRRKCVTVKNDRRNEAQIVNFDFTEDYSHIKSCESQVPEKTPIVVDRMQDQYREVLKDLDQEDRYNFWKTILKRRRTGY